MSSLVKGDADYVASIVVKSRSIFPDLVPFADRVEVVSKRRSSQVFATFGVGCEKVLASLPLGNLSVIFAIFYCASA